MSFKDICIIVSIFIVIICMMVLVPAANTTTPEDIIASTIVVTDGYGHGSGVYLGNGVILTAGHCLGIQDAWIEDSKGNQYSILNEVYCGDWTEDIGFIMINPKVDIPAMTKFGDMPELNDKVHICGTPLERVMGQNFTTGTITKLDVDFPDGWWDDAIIADAASYPGNSGGGVYNEDLELIGILVGGFVGYDNIAIIEGIDDIMRQINLEVEL